MRAGPQSWIIHLHARILNTEGEMQRKERERRSEELNETESGEVKTTEGHTLMEVVNLSSSLVVEDQTKVCSPRELTRHKLLHVRIHSF